MSELGNERISTEPGERANGALGESDIEGKTAGASASSGDATEFQMGGSI
jgi:hypothetical protein